MNKINVKIEWYKLKTFKKPTKGWKITEDKIDNWAFINKYFLVKGQSKQLNAKQKDYFI